MIQLQFLNYILFEKDTSVIILNNLTDEYFSDYKAEFGFILNHIKQYNITPDLETFLKSFPSFEIIKVSEKVNFLLEELYKDKSSRKLAEVFNNIRKLLLENKIDDAMKIYKNAYNQLTQNVSLRCVDILRDTSRYDAFIERSNDFSKFFVKTGFQELDEIIGGWDRDEELATIAARTGKGKTWILLKCAAAAAEQGLTVGIYSGEMSARKIGYRLDTIIGHISNGSLIHGNAAIQNQYKKYLDELPNMYKGKIKILTPDLINGPAGVNSLRTFIDKEALDILFIDQHSLLEDDNKARNPIEKAANISRDLKNLQVMKKIPIIAVSQQNRSSTESGVDTTHIAQSDRIGQDSTIILFIERNENIIKLELVKSRDTENSKTLSYNVDFNTGFFTFIPEEDKNIKSENSEQYQHRYEVESEDVEEVF